LQAAKNRFYFETLLDRQTWGRFGHTPGDVLVWGRFDWTPLSDMLAADWSIADPEFTIYLYIFTVCEIALLCYNFTFTLRNNCLVC